ncbi:MAG: sigma-54-dependent Fis family transcriptional regulator [Deltaproteobacteria bacterium]|nr:sigma-54-dependent Fis family transcriptional regulator [Deltaproteobacteria bacterium]
MIETTQRLLTLTEPEDLLQTILESTLRLFAAQACSIALVDENAQQLSFAFTLGGAKLEEVHLPLGQGIIGWVAAHGEGVICNDVATEPRFFGQIDRQTGFRTKMVLCAPLRHEGRLVGAIEVLNTAAVGGFQPTDLELLAAFGGLATPALYRTKAATAIQKAKVAFAEVVHERYRLVGGSSPAMQEALHVARSAAVANSTVLLLGESGTGKEVIARAIHQWSPRVEQPSVAVNCVALTPELLESELFGHEKGAFTGAIAQKRGKFELADGGTIFLDEIGDLAPNLQAKLLRVLQEKEFQRVGGVKDFRVDVRVIAATNRNLRQAMQQGQFREDLYYRLNVVPITLPPLRERSEDLPALIEHCTARYCDEMKRPRLMIDTAAMAALQQYAWPGNVRELQNIIERATVLSQGPVLSVADLPGELRQQSVSPLATLESYQPTRQFASLAEAIETVKREQIQLALDENGGNQTKAARRLGLPRPNLSRLMKQLGLR